MKNWYSSAEVVRATGATYRQIDHWLRRGYGPTSNNGRVGTGHIREMSLRLVFQLAIVKAVVDLGVKPALLGEQSFHQLFTEGELQHGPVRVILDLAFIRDRLCDKLETTATEGAAN